MIIDSINLLLGNRLSREMIRTGESEARVSAVFEEIPERVCEQLREMGFACEDGTLMIRRTLGADGRTKTHIDGQSVTQAVQREIMRLLVSIHGQSDSQKLLQKAAHRELLDAYAAPDAEMQAYCEAYRALRRATEKLEAASRDESERIRLCEMLRYQIEDIDSVHPKEGEEEALIKERDRLLNAEQINRLATLSYRALRGGEKGGAYDLLRRAQNAIAGLSSMIEGADALADRLETVAAEVDDIAESVEVYLEDDVSDPTAKIDKLEGRLEAISKLKRKYGATVREVLAFRENAAARLEESELSDEERLKLERDVKRLTKEAMQCASALTQKRREASERIVGEVTESLAFLDMPKVRFEIAIRPSELGEHGCDDVEFMIATNPGEPLLPMIKIASGGELSRIMLALRSVLNDRDGASTVIFDEIDTGVSGKTARKVGIKLKETAKHTQVICVTHSAQIASLGDTHYRISKNEKDGRAETDVHPLSGEERVEEIARILGGIEITNAQRDAAREMLCEYR